MEIQTDAPGCGNNAARGAQSGLWSPVLKRRRGALFGVAPVSPQPPSSHTATPSSLPFAFRFSSTLGGLSGLNGAGGLGDSWFSDEQQVKSAAAFALLNLSVNLLGALAMLAIYYNYVLLQPYFAPFFWAVMISIPLHSIKSSVVRFLQKRLKQDSVGFNVPKLVLGAVVLPLKVLLGPLWGMVLAAMHQYQHIIHILTPSHSHVPPNNGAHPLEHGVAHKRKRSGSFKGSVKAPVQKKKQSDAKKKKQQKGKRSSIYFETLFRSCGLYLAYQILLAVGIYHFLFFWFACAMLAIVYGLAVIFRALLLKYLPWSFLTGLSKTTKRHFNSIPPCRWIALAALHVYRLCCGFFSMLRSLEELALRKLKEFFLKNIHSIISAIIIVVFLISVIFLGAMFVVKVGQEATAMGDALYYYVDQYQNHVFGGTDFSNKTSLVFGTGYQSLISWGDKQVQQYIPMSNVSQVYGNIRDSFDLLYQKFQGEGDTQGTAQGFLASLPVCYQMVESLARGNFSCVTSETLNQAASEMYESATQVLNHDETVISTAKEYGITLGKAMVSSGFSFVELTGLVFVTFINGCLFALGIMFEFLLFIMSLYYLLSSERSCIEIFRGLFMFGRGDGLLESMELSIKAVFESSFKMYTFHIVFTWLTFRLFGLDYGYISSFFSGLIAIMPFASTWVICVPTLFSLFMKGQILIGALLFTIHFAATWIVDDAIYRDIPNSHPLFAGLSIVLGIYAFNIYGVLLGPILACIPSIVYSFLETQVKGLNNPGTGLDDSFELESEELKKD